jgi:hypothetical protein
MNKNSGLPIMVHGYMRKSVWTHTCMHSSTSIDEHEHDDDHVYFIFYIFYISCLFALGGLIEDILFIV